jgi:hypothetical protein
MLRAVGRVTESGGEEKGRVKGRNERKATKTERKNLGVYARRERQGAERKGRGHRLVMGQASPSPGRGRTTRVSLFKLTLTDKNTSFILL